MSDPKSIAIEVRGEPKGQPRARPFVTGGRVRCYTPGTAEAWKSAIAAAIKDYLPFEPWEGPVCLQVCFRFRRPKAHLRANGQVKPTAPQFKTGRPDADNLLKAVMDALTEIGLWRDDGQVASVSSKAYYAEPEGATITATRLEDSMAGPAEEPAQLSLSQPIPP